MGASRAAMGFFSEETIEMAIEALLSVPVSNRNIGGLVFDVVLEEKHRDELVITKHPVERGAEIADHAYANPAEVVIRASSSLSGANADGPLYLQDLYQALLSLQQNRQPFEIITGKRTYENMLVRIIELRTDEHSENILDLTIYCQEIFMAQVVVTTIIQNANLASPESNATMVNQGQAQLKAAPTFNSSVVPGSAGQSFDLGVPQAGTGGLF
jgi:hypothetical protein